ncbi:MAG: ribonuclease H family protein [Eubacterium sp.]|nr:ribonuclease H family protein [Eubacterium sp.]
MATKAANKFYAVRKGRNPGIYYSWSDCEKNVKGFPGAEFKSFKELSEAEEYVKAEAGPARLKKISHENDDSQVSESAIKPDIKAEVTAGSAENYAFVDGSFNSATGVYGYGGFLMANGEKIILQGSGNDREMAEMRNVAGEICGSVAAVKRAIKLGLSKVSIYYDYMGIEKWATGEWKRNKTGTAHYHEVMQKAAGLIEIEFIKVKGHSGVAGNEEADRLAKEAVGIL